MTEPVLQPPLLERLTPVLEQVGARRIRRPSSPLMLWGTDTQVWAWANDGVLPRFHVDDKWFAPPPAEEQQRSAGKLLGLVSGAVFDISPLLAPIPGAVVTLDEAAVALRCARTKVKNLAVEGLLPAFEVGNKAWRLLKVPKDQAFHLFDDYPPMLLKKDVATLFRLEEPTITRLARKGDLPGFKYDVTNDKEPWRFRASDLLREVIGVEPPPKEIMLDVPVQ